MSETALGLRFTVTIDGQTSLGDWTKCEGLTVEYDVHEYKEGGINGWVWRLPGRAKYQNIKLTRPVTKSTADVANWLSTVKPSDEPDDRQDRRHGRRRARRSPPGPFRVSTRCGGPGRPST